MYDEVVLASRIPRGSHPRSRGQALVYKGITLGGELGRDEDAVLVYDDVVARFGDAPEANLRK